MHDDLLRISEFSAKEVDYSLLAVPPGYRWSDDVWISRRGDWVAFYRTLNLALVFVRRQLFGSRIPSGAGDESKQLFGHLSAEKLLIPCDKNSDERERNHLLEAARRGAFRFICVLPTTSCSLKCVYCHQRPGKGGGISMTSAEIHRGLKKCADLCTDDSKPVDVLIYGGEPLLAFGLTEEILRSTSTPNGLFKQRVRLSFTTSGTGLTEDQADYLTEHHVFVIVSMDGLPESHNRVRKAANGAGSFSEAERAYRLLKEKGCRVGISVTIGKHNMHHLPQHLEFLLTHFEPADIGLNAFLHRLGEKPNPYQVKSDNAFRQFLEGFAVTQKFGVYAEQPFRRLKPFVSRRPLLKDCSSPGERLVLAPGGLLGFCDSCYPDSRYFYPLEDFPDRDHPDHRLWLSLSSPEMPSCRECPAMTVCGGACRYDAYKASGRLDGIDPDRCRFEHSFLTWMIWELFDRSGRSDALYYVPQDEERESLFGNVVLRDENQPFTAGSYSE